MEIGKFFTTVFTGMVDSLWIIALVAIIAMVLLAIFYVPKFKEKLIENEKLKYEFITIIAHKFRTPLTQMKWICENLESGETDPFKKENLFELQKANQKLINLTSTLIELTDSDNDAKSSYSLESLPVCELVKITSEPFKSVFHEKNIFFSLICEDPQIKISVDRPRMEFVLQTLLENACSYTPPGRNVTMVAMRQENTVFISLKDEGIGMNKEMLQRLFSKFYRGENAQKMDTEGFGVGLYLAKSIIERHRGSLTAYSEGEGKGSEFVIALPIA